ncbi:MAG: MoxR family ATPase [Candidatus Neomarinimicrobiota bacterium]|nr:MoxR family ATPase [Candidatus Neomarinimicrobiota bacterium]
MESFDLDQLNQKIKEDSAFIEPLLLQLKSLVIGQDDLIEKLILAVLANGHVFIEGVPGLGKTHTVNALAKSIDAKFNRIQFTPDLLPADIIGTLIYDQKNSSFEVKKGPIFSNIILADEINRSPAKVQSALLEAMQERQVTIGDKTYKMDDPFLVMATQNPIEQEGTYPLPEAQVDRFMFKILINYPADEEELLILQKMSSITEKNDISPNVSTDNLLKARKTVDKIHIAENLQKYIVSLVTATRSPEKFNLSDLKGLLDFGASPRATLFLVQASKALAFMKNRAYVVPEDIRNVGMAILRHRIILSFEAEAEEINSDEIIKRIFESVPTP